MKTLFLIASLLVTTTAMTQFSSGRELLIFGYEPGNKLAPAQQALLNKELAGLRERSVTVSLVEKADARVKKYAIDTRAFTVLLIGKDGGEKFRSNKLVETEQLFSIIDAMPMRRSEMRRKK